jgi:glycosyltransferase A (GT-A) superfamily protein (DUF2064 family)
VLLDAPRPEFVPPALLAELGERHAVRLRRVIARRTILAIESLGWVPVIWFTPPDALPEMHRWLGDDRAFEPQVAGHVAATLEHLAGQAGAGEGWLVVRPAGAGIPPDILQRADAALAAGGIACGATTQDDLYLLGGPDDFLELAGALPWGERDLASSLRARLRDAGRSWAELPRVRDVLSPADARDVGLLT